MALLKLHCYSEAEKDCTLAIKKDPKFTKAVLRRAVARKNQGKLQSALKDAHQMTILAPGNAAAIALHKQLQVAIRKLQAASKGNINSPSDIETMMRLKVTEDDGDTSGEEEFEAEEEKAVPDGK
mmetsp:Transcript_7498/g.14651  ORF Transcript_7498/g.14651 Transcript_7498/m.14651 type:complete len:125 (-) Transcript_7498:246-620(-)